MNPDLCGICQGTLDKPLIQVRLKGSETFIDYSEERNLK